MGQYLEITSGPSVVPEAEAGELVIVYLGIRNKHTAAIYVRLVATNDIYAETNSALLNPGDWSWNVRFTMPNHSVSGVVEVQYWGTDDKWHTDDTGSFSVTLAGEAPPPEISGSIESLKVYAEGTAPVNPPLNVTPGKRISIKFDAHSGYGSFPFGLWFDATVILKKPVSGEQERFDRSETGPYSRCTLDHFDFKNDWTADEKGTYYATIILRARSSLTQSSVEVDRKSNVRVFTVTEDIPPPGEYSGDITKVQARTGVANWGAYPLSLELGDNYSVAVTVVNRSSIALVLRGELTITKPSGNKDYASDFTGTSVPYIETTVSPGASHTFKWNPYPSHAFVADELGDYQASFILKGKKAGEADSMYRQLCDPWEGKIATVTEAEDEEPEPGKYEGSIENKLVDLRVTYPGGEVAFPAAEPAAFLPGNIRICFDGYNRSDKAMRLRAEVWIYGPDEEQVYHAEDTSTAPYTKDTCHTFYFPKPPASIYLEKAGSYTIKIQLTNSSGEYLLAEYDGALFTAEEAPPSLWPTIIEMMPLMMIMMMFAMIVPMMQDVGKMFEEEVVTYRVEEAPPTVPPERRLPPGR